MDEFEKALYRHMAYHMGCLSRRFSKDKSIKTTTFMDKPEESRDRIPRSNVKPRKRKTLFDDDTEEMVRGLKNDKGE